MSKISATIVADSINQQGDRITTMLVTFPRFILAELNTHRMLSKNSASSRAIPFNKMVESVQNDPFIPIAWQKEHSGMQGTEYLTNKDSFEDDYGKYSFNVVENTWLKTRDEAVKQAKKLTKFGVTKQLANRLLEPFMWHTVLITSTEWENFFSLRCPQYESTLGIFRSWRDLSLAYSGGTDISNSYEYFDGFSTLERLSKNKGMAEIHMMALAEAMWDAMNESKPKQLQPGEWHIPFEDKIILSPTIPIDEGYTLEEGVAMRKVKIATAMAARTSYTVVGDEKEFTTEQQISLHDRMANQVPFHASPFEHCARVMYQNEYETYHKGRLADYTSTMEGYWYKYESIGWCRNYRGFIQYREILEHDKN